MPEDHAGGAVTAAASAVEATPGPEAPRPPCPAPADFRAEVVRYDRDVEVDRWDGPRYRLTYRILGQGPTLFLIPGIASTYRVYALLLNRLAEHFRTIVYDYPGEHTGDGARLRRVTHDHLVDDLFGLIDHLNVGRAFLAGLSFGSTIALEALRREPRRFPRSALQGGFAHRRFSAAERWALRLGRLVPGTVSRLPLQPHGPDLQQPAGVPLTPGRPLGLLHRAERIDADPVPGPPRSTSSRAWTCARSSR